MSYLRHKMPRRRAVSGRESQGCFTGLSYELKATFKPKNPTKNGFVARLTGENLAISNHRKMRNDANEAALRHNEPRAVINNAAFSSLQATAPPRGTAKTPRMRRPA